MLCRLASLDIDGHNFAMDTGTKIRANQNVGDDPNEGFTPFSTRILFCYTHFYCTVDTVFVGDC